MVHAGGCEQRRPATSKRGLEALEQAAAKGFRGWERVESEPLLARLRRDARYAAVLAKLRG